MWNRLMIETLRRTRMRRTGCLSISRSSTSLANSQNDTVDPNPRFGSKQIVSEEFYGQPLPITHPHLLKPDELTVGITSAEYESRRKRLIESMEDDSIVIVAGNRLKWMSHHVFFPFRQSSDFFYLTGFLEPDSCVVLEKDSSQRGYKMMMFVRDKDYNQEMWDGARTGINGVIRWFGADEAFDICELAIRLKPILTNQSSRRSPVYLDLPDDIEHYRLPTWKPSRGSNLFDFFNKKDSQSADLIELLTFKSLSTTHHNQSAIESCLNLLSRAKTGPSRQPRFDFGSSRKRQPSSENHLRLESLRSKLDEQKMIKSPAELRLLRIAADISAKGFKASFKLAARCDDNDSYQGTKTLMSENDLVEEFEKECRRFTPGYGGRMGYVPVCAAGKAALTIHYTSNDRALSSRYTTNASEPRMVLLDAGYEYNGYVADITRTFPIGNCGKFSSSQKDLYELVKTVQKTLIDSVLGSDSESLSSLHRRSCELLRGGLKDLGFDDLYKDSRFERLYPHYVGHPIGTDLHDSPTWDRSKKLKAGSVITIEPGIYVPNEDRFPRHFRGIGIRIEDMVHVNEVDKVILSVNTPKEIVDVENCAIGYFEELKK
ncbi:X-Pro aminopeptidase [Phakopsora pachyrhizi]|nr:X-Pro aminopeptidase [Phakopsora pachyrhizi]